MQQRKDTPDGCLDDETLAAYVDGGLTADERSRVELHLAACQDCFAVFTETVKTVQAMRAEDGDVVDVPSGAVSEVSATEVGTPAVVVPMPPRRSALARRLVMVGGLAAAVFAYFAVVPSRDPVDDAYENLVIVVGATRPTTARLSGGFIWGPPPPILRSGDQSSSASSQVRMSALRLQRLAETNPSMSSLARVGVSHLLLGDVDGAVERLERAASASEDARVWNDFAAALLERHRRFGAHQDLVRGTAAAARATALDSSLAEAWFNLALAKLAADDSDGAAAATDALARLEPSSPWLKELREYRRTPSP